MSGNTRLVLKPEEIRRVQAVLVRTASMQAGPLHQSCDLVHGLSYTHNGIHQHGAGSWYVVKLQGSGLAQRCG